MQYVLYQPTQVMEVSGSGAVTALEPGWNYVIASSKNTMFDSNMCLITVVDTLPAQSVSVSLAAGSAGILSENVLPNEAGSTAQLEAAVEPYNSSGTPGTGDDTSIPAMVGAALSLLTSLVYIAYSIYSSRKIAGEQER